VKQTINFLSILPHAPESHDCSQIKHCAFFYYVVLLQHSGKQTRPTSTILELSAMENGFVLVLSGAW